MGGVAIAATGVANQIDRHRVGEDDDITGNMLWARRGNEFVTVKSLNEQGQPVGVEIFHYRDDLSLESYIYARSATIEDDKTWILHGVNHKKWLNGKETLEILDNLAWQSTFTSMNLEELSMPGNSFSVRQLNHYINYLQETDNRAVSIAWHCGKSWGIPF